MGKQTFHQNILGKQLIEDAKHAALNEMVTFKYHGLTGPSVTIVGTWIDDGTVVVLAQDAQGKTAKLYLTHYIIQEAK